MSVCGIFIPFLKRLFQSLQQEKHDPVKTVRRIRQFTWTMTKLNALMASSLDEEGSVMTRHKKIMSMVEERENGGNYYQGIKLFRFDEVCSSAAKRYKQTTMRLAESMND